MTEIKSLVAFFSGRWAGQWLIWKGYDRTFWGDRNALCLDKNIGYTHEGFVKTNGTLVTLKPEHFIIQKLYINKKEKYKFIRTQKYILWVLLIIIKMGTTKTACRYGQYFHFLFLRISMEDVLIFKMKNMCKVHEFNH